MRRFIKSAAAAVSLIAVAGCEAPYTGQVMCWQENTATGSELICVPLRAMRGVPVPEGAFIRDADGRQAPGAPGNPVQVPNPTPGPTTVFEYTSVGDASVAVEVGSDGGVQSSQTERGSAGAYDSTAPGTEESSQVRDGSASAYDSNDPGSGRSTQDVFEEVGSQLEDAGMINPFSQ